MPAAPPQSAHTRPQPTPAINPTGALLPAVADAADATVPAAAASHDISPSQKVLISASNMHKHILLLVGDPD